MGEGGSDGDVGDLILNDYCDYGSPEEDPESKIDIHYHPLKEEPEPELGDGDGDAVEVDGYCDYDPPKRGPEPVLPATGDGTGADGGRDVGHNCCHCGVSLSTQKFKVEHELRCEVRMKQKGLEPQVTKLYNFRYRKCPFLNKECNEQRQQKYCRKRPVAMRKDSRKDNLKKHVAKHNKNNADWFTCIQCSYKTVHKYTMNRHMKIHDNTFSCGCPICGKNFRTKLSLDDHLLRHHSDESDQVSKMISSKTYTYKTGRKADYFECDTCGFVTNYKGSLARHFLTHNKNNAEWFTCTQCSFKTVRKYAMTRHMKVHDNAFSYYCSICGKSFRTKVRLDNHLVREHFDKSDTVSKLISSKTYTYKTGRKADYFECDKCEFVTNYKDCLARHFLTHNKNNAEWFTCTHCSYKTVCKYNMTRHMKIHDNTFSYCCPICRKNFITKLCLDDHLVRQHPDESDQVSKLILSKTYKTGRKADYFECDKCQFVTRRKDSLGRHLLTHNKKNA